MMNSSFSSRNHRARGSPESDQDGRPDTHVCDNLIKNDLRKRSGGLGSAPSGDEDADNGEDADDENDDGNTGAVIRLPLRA